MVTAISRHFCLVPLLFAAIGFCSSGHLHDRYGGLLKLSDPEPPKTSLGSLGDSGLVPIPESSPRFPSGSTSLSEIPGGSSLSGDIPEIQSPKAFQSTVPVNTETSKYLNVPKPSGTWGNLQKKSVSSRFPVCAADKLGKKSSTLGSSKLPSDFSSRDIPVVNNVEEESTASEESCTEKESFGIVHYIRNPPPPVVRPSFFQYVKKVKEDETMKKSDDNAPVILDETKEKKSDDNVPVILNEKNINDYVLVKRNLEVIGKVRRERLLSFGLKPPRYRNKNLGTMYNGEVWRKHPQSEMTLSSTIDAPIGEKIELTPRSPSSPTILQHPSGEH